MGKISYGIDEADTLVFVDQDWDSFARENDAPELLKEKVVGRNLWDFVTDGVTRALYRGALQQVRRGYSVELTLRCDAPWERRLVVLEVNAGVRADIEFHALQLSTKQRPYQQLLNRNRVNNSSCLFFCCWCNRISSDMGGWFEVEEALERLNLDPLGPLPFLEDVTCPVCYLKTAEILSGSTGIAQFRYLDERSI